MPKLLHTTLGVSCYLFIPVTVRLVALRRKLVEPGKIGHPKTSKQLWRL